jgi:redox-regulated HSP33 family molecular chaperone
VRYLHETDPAMKRYYACHCPLLREAIRNGQPISSDVCNCSLGHASHYLAGLGQDLKGEVLESAVKGDVRCRFVFYLPDKVR